MTDTKLVYVPTHTIQHEGKLNEVVLSWQTFALTVPEEYRNDANVDITYGDDYLEIHCYYFCPKTDEEKAQDAVAAIVNKVTMLEYYKQKIAELEEAAE